MRSQDKEIISSTSKQTHLHTYNHKKFAMDIDLDKDLHRIDINFENIFYNVNVPKQKGKSRFHTKL